MPQERIFRLPEGALARAAKLRKLLKNFDEWHMAITGQGKEWKYILTRPSFSLMEVDENNFCCTLNLNEDVIEFLSNDPQDSYEQAQLFLEEQN